MYLGAAAAAARLPAAFALGDDARRRGARGGGDRPGAEGGGAGREPGGRRGDCCRGLGQRCKQLECHKFQKNFTCTLALCTTFPFIHARAGTIHDSKNRESIQNPNFQHFQMNRESMIYQNERILLLKELIHESRIDS